ncbi:skin secretory protein xP2-like isoform X1 [Seriola lalandi dorsalis]|uniref:skin secretory protein xP2-like isoform X1 n=1 Tax=Seriola lalandi dorsalis TaxID=1841481 RepID=UPI000C6F44A0|nr:skin secretory protein xP2-like isoform X1 [Seriola lalandi dorsalis]
MMSYLWILLLGSLLATSAKAQDDQVPAEEETAAPDAPAPATEAPEVEGEAKADEGTDHNAEEVPPTVSAPEPTAEPESEGEEPAGEDAEQATHAAGDEEPVTPVAGDEEPVTPAVGDVEQANPAAGDEELVNPAGDGAEEATAVAGEAEEVTPAAVDVEGEAAATTQEPETEPEEKNPEGELPTADVEEETTSSIDTTPSQVGSEPEDKATPGSNPAVEDGQEQPTDPGTDVGQTEGNVVPDIRTGVKDLVPTVKVDGDTPEVNSGFNLEDAVDPKEDTQVPPGKSRSIDDKAHVAGAAGDVNEPQAQEGSSSSLAGILSTVGVALVGAVTGYFTYQKKKLCFKNRQEADPEAARKADAAEAQSDPQVLSNLLNSS